MLKRSELRHHNAEIRIESYARESCERDSAWPLGSAMKAAGDLHFPMHIFSLRVSLDQHHGRCGTAHQKDDTNLGFSASVAFFEKTSTDFREKIPEPPR